MMSDKEGENPSQKAFNNNEDTLQSFCNDFENMLSFGSQELHDNGIDVTEPSLSRTETPDGYRSIRGAAGINRSRPDQLFGPHEPLGTPFDDGSVGRWRRWNSVSSMGVARTDRGSYIPYPGENLSQYPYLQNQPPHTFGPPGQSLVELQVTNLDQTIDQKDMKKILLSLFRQFVYVQNVSVFFQSDGNMAASVKVGSLQDAQFAISKFHRTKIGFKRILIAYSHNNSQNLSLIRAKVMSLLSEVPGGRLQLFKFREMFEKRFHASIGISDLYKMRDLISVFDGPSGRMVQLNTSAMNSSFQYRNIPSNAFANNYSLRSTLPPAPLDVNLDTPYCVKHAPKASEEKGWAEKENGTSLPVVCISLKTFSQNMRTVVKNHGGSAPLASIVYCYENEFEPLVVDKEDGVPLEHLVSCIKGLQIQQGSTGCKTIITIGFWEDEVYAGSNHSGSATSLPSLVGFSNGFSPNTPGPQAILPPCTPAQTPLAGQLSLFSRELVDLLKSQDGCRMPFHKFIPSYHHFFGRQCRVADYGYTKLKDLFDALPHIVQIMGEGSRATITLSHRAQIKRFSSDLMRVLKSQPSKQVAIADFSAIYEKVFGKQFKINDYGVCEIEDMLREISETSVVLSGSGDEMIVSLPKREQTLDEVEKTHQFAEECIELLRHAPDCRLPFNKFIPSYHHHFGRQCRVADYGFTKLVELFEAVPGTVEVTEDADGERILQLTDSEKIKVIGDHVANLVKSSQEQVLHVSELGNLYRKQYGYLLRPEDFGKETLLEVLELLYRNIKVETNDDGEPIIRIIDKSYLKALVEQVRNILISLEDGEMKLDNFTKTFEEKYGTEIDIDTIEKDLNDVVEIVNPQKENSNSKDPDNNNNSDNNNAANEKSSVDDRIIRLSPLQLCANRIKELIKDYDGKLLCSELEAAFVDKYKTPLCPGQFGFHSVNALIQSGLGKFFSIRGRGPKKAIVPIISRSPSEKSLGSISLTNGGGFKNRARHTVDDNIYNMDEARSPFPTMYSQLSTDTVGDRGTKHSNLSHSPMIRFSTQRHEGFRMVSYHNQIQQKQHGYPRTGLPVQQSFGNQSLMNPNFYRSGGKPEGNTLDRTRYRQTQLQYWEDLANFGIYPDGATAGNPYLSTPASSFYDRSFKGNLPGNPFKISACSGDNYLNGSALSASPALGSPIRAPVSVSPTRHLAPGNKMIGQGLPEKFLSGLELKEQSDNTFNFE